MVRSRDVVQAEGSARTEGARRATGVRADGAAAGAGALAPGQRWSASRKRDVVLRLLRGESLEALSREGGRGDLPARSVAGASHGWPRTRLKGSSRRASGGGARRGEASHRGTVDGDRAAPRASPGRGAAPPFGDAEVATMSATTSAATGRCFGIQRVCQVWERSRSALYARRARAHHHRLGAGPARRGAPPRQSDAQLLAAIRDRSRAVPVPRRRPSQGPRTASDPGRDPESPARGCCASCGRTDCSPRTAGVRAPRRPTTGGSSPRRPT